jgi:hypothetical protein
MMTSYSTMNAGGAEPGSMGAHAHPSPPPFSKVKEVPFFWAKVPHLKEEKSISWNEALFLKYWSGKKVPFLQ